MPDADTSAARVSAERIRHAVQALRIENLGSTVADVVTVSVGVCCNSTYLQDWNSPHFDDEPGRFVREADAALYAAKRHGRNRVEVATELPVSA